MPSVSVSLRVTRPGVHREKAERAFSYDRLDRLEVVVVKAVA